MTGNDDKVKEPEVNKMIGNFLHSELVGWTILTEKENVIEEKPEWRPDILIVCQYRNLGMVIECEFYPADCVKKEAIRHLGMTIGGDNSPVDFVIALVLPESLRHRETLGVETAEYEFEVFDHSSNSKGMKYNGNLRCLVSVIRELLERDS